MEKKPIKKERAKKYEEKLKINTTLDDVLKASVTEKKKKHIVFGRGSG